MKDHVSMLVEVQRILVERQMLAMIVASWKRVLVIAIWVIVGIQCLEFELADCTWHHRGCGTTLEIIVLLTNRFTFID